METEKHRKQIIGCCQVVLTRSDFKRNGPVPRDIRRELSGCGLAIVDAAKGFAVVDPSHPAFRDSPLAKDAFEEFLNIREANFLKVAALTGPVLVLAYPHKSALKEHLLIKAEGLRREMGLADDLPVVLFWKNKMTLVYPSAQKSVAMEVGSIAKEAKL